MGFGNKDLKKPELKKITDYVWEIDPSFKEGMRVPARIYATQKLLDNMDLAVFDQLTNVATLPGIIRHAYCMPDGHSGYGFPIGGVAAFDTTEGVISPGGVGFDINCGMRLVRTNLTYDDVKPKLKQLVDELYKQVPSGVGSKGFVRITKDEFKRVVEEGSEWAVKEGYGWDEDIQRTEENGRMKGADAKKISQRAIDRGFNQIGTLGSGNHYLEIQVVREEHINDKELAAKFGIFPNQIVVMFHCGSRGFGHQIATDSLQKFIPVMESKYGIKILDKELASAPFTSPEGQEYFAGMQCGVNMAFANRQVILHRIREVFSKTFGQDAEKLDMHQTYDVAHNIAKLEKYKIDGSMKEVLTHRKGATRAFGPENEYLPPEYKDIGQPVIIGGSMETGSYLLVGTKKAEEETWGSTCHGSGRTMSRTKAKKMVRGDRLQKDMEKRGIYVKTGSYSGLAEEAGLAYKDIDEVIKAASMSGISKPVVRLLPIGNVKG